MTKLSEEIEDFRKQIVSGYFNDEGIRPVLNEWVGYREEKVKLLKLVEEMERDISESSIASRTIDLGDYVLLDKKTFLKYFDLTL